MELAGLLGVQLDDEMKHIQTNKKMETNVPGIYAAGDITGPPWQVAKAVGEGCVAGLEAAGYAKKQGPGPAGRMADGAAVPKQPDTLPFMVQSQAAAGTRATLASRIGRLTSAAADASAMSAYHIH